MQIYFFSLKSLSFLGDVDLAFNDNSFIVPSLSRKLLVHLLICFCSYQIIYIFFYILLYKVILIIQIFHEIRIRKKIIESSKAKYSLLLNKKKK